MQTKISPALARFEQKQLAEQEAERNVAVVGRTRSGKTEDEVRAVLDAIARGKQVVVLDPHNSLAPKLERHFIRRRIPFLTDDLSNLRAVLRLNLLERSKKRGIEGTAENEAKARAFTDILVRFLETIILSTPMVSEWLLDGIGLWQKQNPPKDPGWIRYVFLPKSKKLRQMVHETWDDYLKLKFGDLISSVHLQKEVTPARRRITNVFGNQAVLLRAQGGWQFRDGLEEGVNFIFKAKGAGHVNVARDVVSIVFGAISQKVIEYVHEKYNQGELANILMVMDEATRYRLVGEAEVNALNECQKMGLAIHVLFQDLNFGSPEILSGVMQGAQIHKWFACSSEEIARFGALDLLARADPMMVHYHEERRRQVHDGFDEFEIPDSRTHIGSDGKISTSKGTRLISRPRYAEQTEVLDRYMRLSDQITLLARQIMGFKTGWRIEKHDADVIGPFYVPLLREPFSCLKNLGNKFVNDQIERIKLGREYYRPRGTHESSSSSASSPQQSTKRSKEDSSLVMRLRGGAFKNSKNEKKSKRSDSSEGKKDDR